MELLAYWSAAIAMLALLPHVLATARGGRPASPAAAAVPVRPIPRRVARSAAPRDTA